MNIRELFDQVVEELEHNEGKFTIVKDKYPDFDFDLNSLMDRLGCDGLVIQVSDYGMYCTDKDIPEKEWEKFYDDFEDIFEIRLKGRGKLFREESDSFIEMLMSISEGTLIMSIVFSYKDIYLENICDLVTTPWNDGSTAYYRDSVLKGIRMCNVEARIALGQCHLSADLDLSACGILREKEKDYPFGSLLRWTGWVEKPGGEKKDVKLLMESAEFPYRTPFLFRDADEQLEIKSGFMRLQTHYVDEGDLRNYSAENSSEIHYVSCMYKGGYLKSKDERRPCKMFYTLGQEGAYLEFFCNEEADQLIGMLLGGFDWDDLIREIEKKLYSLFTNEGRDKPLGLLSKPEVAVSEKILCIRFCKDEGEPRYILDSIYFIMDIVGWDLFGGCTWIMEGDLTEYNIRNKDIEDFELVATMYDFGYIWYLKLFPFWRSFYGLPVLTRIYESSQMLSVETAHPLGEPIEEEKTDLEGWAPGFGYLPGQPRPHREGSQNASSLKVTHFKGEGSLEDKTFFLELTVDTSSVLTFSIGEFQVSLKEITGYINYTPQNTGIGISGTLRMGFTDTESFELFLAGAYESGETEGKGIWSFEAGLLNGVVSLTDIVNRIMGWKAAFDLEVTAFHVFYSNTGAYAVLCAVSTRFPLFGGTMEIAVSAEVSKRSPDQKAEVMLSGEAAIQYFLFQVTVYLHADSGRSYRFLLEFDELLVTAVYEVPGNLLTEGAAEEQKGGTLTVTLKNFTIGSLIHALFTVLRPNENFKLPKPWDILNRIGFPELKIVYHVDTKDIEVTLPVHIDLLILSVDEVGFTYQNRKDEKEERFNILIRYHSLLPLDDSEDRPADSEGQFLWDALHSPAPGPVAEGSRKKFYLKYFGIGRHIDLGLDKAEDMPLSGILDICRKNVNEEGDVPSNKYNEEYGWYVGAQFTVLEFLDVSLLFYDPVIYGMQAVVLNNDIVPLKGLDLTIYYRKVTEDIGLFYLNAGLPDCIRHMEFGMISITLPSIEVWVYTNGNFKINFGFPENGDFSGCFALSYGIFYGRGGFYFGYLNGDTSSNVPAVANGYFDPVIELGIGITVGVGKSFSLGILKLRAQLEVTGIFEGVFAKFHSRDGAVTGMYYRCSGTAIIAGEISGEVNFLIIRAGFRIHARAAIAASLESGEPTVLAIEASFGVSAYVKIWIFKISFSFSFTYRDTFQLGREEDKPWKISGRMTEEKNSSVFDWTPVVLFEEKIQITAFLTPYYSKDHLKAQWGGRGYEGSEAEAETEKIAVLAAMTDEDFGKLSALLTRYALGAQKRADAEKITVEQAREILEELGKEDCPAFVLEEIYKLFELNLSLQMEAAPCSIHDGKAERMELLGDGEEKNSVPMPFPPVYQVSWYTRRHEGGEEEFDREDYDLGSVEEAKKIFQEYIALVMKNVMQKSVEYLDGKGEVLTADLAGYLEGQAGETGGMVSRFLLHGTRRSQRPLYDVICQQFAGLPKGGWGQEEIVHRLKLSAAGEVKWLVSRETELSVAEGDLDYPQGGLFVRFIREPSRLPSDAPEPKALSLYDCQGVYCEDRASFFLWKMPEEIHALSDFQIHAWPQGSLFTKEESPLRYQCAALVDLTVRKSGNTDTFAVVSASKESRDFLNSLQGREDQITGVRLLFSKEIRKSEEEKPKGAFYSEPGREEKICLVRQNLSETTTAPLNMEYEDAEESCCVRFEEGNRAEFFALLRKMLLIGGDGHYLWIGGEPLESELFGDDGQAVFYFLAELSGPALANRILIYEGIDESSVPVIQDEALGETCISTMKPGKIGFEMVTAGADESVLRCSPYRLGNLDEKVAYRNNLTTQAFTLLYYVLDGKESLPISMQDHDHAGPGENYYSHIMDIPAYDSPVRKIPDMEDPYRGIIPKDYRPGQKAEKRTLPITFYFADVTGNSIGKDYGYQPESPITLSYTDAMLSVTELPMTQISYRIGKGDDEDTFILKLSAVCEQEESVNRLRERLKASGNRGDGQEEEINPEQYALAYYQYAQPDVNFTLCVEFGGIYRESLSWEAGQKDALVQYLLQLYYYAQGIKSGEDAMAPVPVGLEFVLNKKGFQREIKEISLEKISVYIDVRRDPYYVEEGQLPNRGGVRGQAGADQDLEAFSGEFEQAFPGGKVLVGDGLYAAFFPKDALAVYPQSPERLFYALLPFSVKLISRSGMEMTRLRERMEKISSVHAESFLNIDMEVWMEEFLDFYERILSPVNLDHLLAAGDKAIYILNALLKTKRELAAGLAMRTQGVFLDRAGESVFLDEARESLCDMMRKNLRQGYGAAGAAAYCQKGKAGNYALSGELYGPAGVNSAKVMPGRSSICFLTVPQQSSSANTLSMEEAVFRFTHLEDQTTGKWYRFVNAFEQIRDYVRVDLGNYESGDSVILPVPLRRYPTAPKLTRQYAKGGNLIPGNLTWSYAFSMEAVLSAQDRVHVILSTGQGENFLCYAEKRDLFYYLAQFIYDREAYEALLIRPVKMNENDIRCSAEEETDGAMDQILPALADFGDLAGQIQRCCVEKDCLNDWKPEYEFVFQCVYEEQRLGRISFFIDEGRYPEGIPYPCLSVTDSSGQSARIGLSLETMSYEMPPEITVTPQTGASYEFVIGDIPLERCQGLLAEVFLKRNEEFHVLPGGEQPRVNPGFVYETDRTGFQNPAHPCIRMNETYDAGSFSVDRAADLLKKFIYPEAEILTELTVWLGQMILGGNVVYRPVGKRIRHMLTEESARQFLNRACAEWAGKGLEGQERYFVRLGVRQFPGKGDAREEVMLVEADQIVFGL